MPPLAIRAYTATTALGRGRAAQLRALHERRSGLRRNDFGPSAENGQPLDCWIGRVDGLEDAATGVRGWNQKADVGSQPVGQGLFYVSVNSTSEVGQTADLTLMQWTGDAQEPLVPVMAQELQDLVKEPAARDSQPAGKG